VVVVHRGPHNSNRVPSFVLRRFGLLITVVALAAYAAVHAASVIDAPIHSDGYSSYVSLPAWFLAHDPTLQATADECCGGTLPAFTSIIRWASTGRLVNPPPIGVPLPLSAS